LSPTKHLFRALPSGIYFGERRCHGTMQLFPKLSINSRIFAAY
jgi:hypothetical protein